jgi:hypothetical protein
MKVAARWAGKIAGGLLVLLLVVGIAAPYVSADHYGERLRGALERSLGRRVDFRGQVRFSLFKGPGFAVENVVIHEDPSIGMEPVAYMDSMEVRPSLWSLLGGRFVIASIRLDGAHINLAKTGPAAEPGRWNFASLVKRSVLSTTPAIHVRNGRINFRFGETKSVFYLTGTDLDISPPGPGGTGWRVACTAQPARTDRPGQGLGSFTLKGRWYVAPERVDLDLDLDRTGLGEITALLRGQAGSVHGTVTSRLHLGGPIQNIGIAGRLTVEDVHRWDLLPPQGQGWSVDVRGRLDLAGDRVELESSPPGNTPLPLWVRFRATDYLSQPHWAVTVNWNRFPVGPLMQLARHMGAELPPGLELSGTLDGALGYSGRERLQGELAFHDTAVTIPDSPPVRFEQARIVFDHGQVRLAPALVRTANDDQAQIEASYAINEGTVYLSISTEAMKVESLRAQVALAAVPWLEQVGAGQWSGRLNYHSGAGSAGWTGNLQIKNATVPVPGLAHPIEIASARAEMGGARVVLDRIDAAAGKVPFGGSYLYEPGAAHPHRVRLRIGHADAADIEAELMPTLRRSTSLIARALGRTGVPDWMKDRSVEGTVYIEDLALAGTHLEDFRGRLVWEVARAELDAVQAKIDRATVSGKLAVNLRGARPSYRFAGKVKGLAWRSGKVDAEGSLETSGTGSQLLARLTSGGTFSGAALDIGAPAPLRALAGTYSLAWRQSTPVLQLTNLNLRTEEDTYTGQGATQDDGRLLILLTSGEKEMRLTGTLAKLKVEER